MQLQADQIVELIQLEYAELPGLKLTATHAQRLWSVSTEMCMAALQIVTERRCLARTTGGVYMLRSQHEPPRAGLAML